MSNLVIKGMKQVGNMKFHHIEGGFGKGKRSMLVKEIASIHGKELKYINKQINTNRKRFEDGIDIVDLKDTEFEVHLMNSGIYSQNAINASTNIYILSERGYSKLLKILEDDFAWEQYEKLVDGYFNMRQTIKDGKQVQSPEDKKKLADARLRNAKARQANILLKIADKQEINPRYKQVLYSYATAITTGKELLPLPETEEKTFTAEEIGKQLGISANMVGRLAKKHNLKTEQFGKLFHDKSRYSAKEVESFRYFKTVIPVLKGFVNNKVG